VVFLFQQAALPQSCFNTKQTDRQTDRQTDTHTHTNKQQLLT